MKDLETKYILKKACKGIIPEEVLQKKKQGFAIPRNEWLGKDLKEYIKEVLLDAQTLHRGYFRSQALERIVNNFLRQSRSCSTRTSGLIVSLVTLELWHRIYMDKK